MKLVFATHNNHKVAEIKPLFPSNINIITLNEIGILDEIPETGETLKDNAIIKARVIHDEIRQNCFADDTGLEVDALNGEPGVYSARYAGEGKSASDNIEKLLFKLKGATSRTAKFKTVITAIIDDKEYIFEGVVEGEIAEMKIGDKGFGYDPVFVPKGYEKSFAQMTLEEKNNLSHRSIAVKKFAEFLKEKP
ncbi:MAG TPA: non-canonical purine NTP diphosphatase [Bacteroidia bacterium]|jgi:XTP/dITP diphosphohydrolase|nr:non-canonical purine NTP diphosphatase [Bacteroidia bacterium]